MKLASKCHSKHKVLRMFNRKIEIHVDNGDKL